MTGSRIVRGVVFLMGVSCTPAFSAVWDEFPVLVCRGVRAMDCSITDQTCRNRETTAVWRVDFRTNRVTYFGGEFSEVILLKNIERYRGRALSENIFLDSGRTMRFEAPTRDDRTGPRVRAVLAGSALGNVNVTEFECAPLPLIGNSGNPCFGVRATLSRLSQLSARPRRSAF